LLVVLSIIAVLAALTTAAVMRFREAGPRKATSANLGKILTALNEQWKAVRDQAASESKTSAANQPFLTQAQVKNGNKPATDPTVKKYYVKLKLIQAFPTSFSEALAPDGNTALAWQSYVRHLASLGVTSANAGTWSSTPLEVQQSVCVLMILEKGPRNNGTTRDNLGTTAWGTQTLANGQDAPAIRDGWRRAVLFTRSYQGQTDTTPALLSAGSDGKFGVDATTFVQTTPGDAGDNIEVVNP